MSSPDVVVSLGTYHLPFNRLVEWVDTWAAANPGVSVLVQHGVSQPAANTANVDMLAHEELLAMYAHAKVLVLQGGAGGIMDAGAVGVVPIVVPRVPQLGEVVDDHQLQFTSLLEKLHLAHVALQADSLHELLTGALNGQLPTRREQQHEATGVVNILARLEEVGERRRGSGGRQAWRRLRHLFVAGPGVSRKAVSARPSRLRSPSISR